MRRAPVKIATLLASGSLLLGSAAAAPAAWATTPVATAAAAAAAAVTPDAGTRTSLVSAWYEQFLGRSATGDAGAQYWVVRLRTEAPAAVLADLLRTPEAVTLEVDDLYATYLGRGIAGDVGAGSWVGGITSGAFPAEWAEQNILASPEYARLNSAPGGSAGPLVDAWYTDVLGRAPRAGEEGYWAQQLAGSSRLGVLREIWYTPEAVGLRVAAHYEAYLQRPANPGEIGYWSGAETASDVGVLIAIATSTEYQDNSPTFLA